MLGILIYVGDGEAIMKGGRPNLDVHSTLLGLDLAHCECMFWGPLRALQLRAAARVSHPTTAPMLHHVHYCEGDLSPQCSAC